MVPVQRKSIGQSLREFAAWLHEQPFTLPLLRLAYSRKAMIATALVGYILTQLPKLTPVAGEVAVVVAELVLISFVALFTCLGYVIEDVAEKRALAANTPFLG